jgi:cytochrome c oxidase subunit 2
LGQRDYDKWFQEGSGPAADMSLEQYGQSLYNSKRCVTCHSIDGSSNVGPSFMGLYGAAIKLEGGKSVTVDENYIRESILEPQAKIVAGFPPVMPTFQGLLKDRDLDALVAYIKSLDNQRGKHE